MDRTLRYLLRTSPGELLEIARSRIEDLPSVSIMGDCERGSFAARGIRIRYAMLASDGGTELTLTISRKPPVPWKIVKSYMDREAEKW